MKKTAILLAFAIAATACAESNRTFTISGVIKNCPSDMILLGNDAENMQDQDTVYLGNDGSFTYTATIGKDAFGYIMIPGRTAFTTICIGGTNTSMEADASSYEAVASFTGDLEREYGFNNSYMKLNRELQGRTSYSSFNEMRNLILSERDSLYKVLETLDSKRFVRLQKEMIERNTEQALHNYHFILRMKNLAYDSDPDYNAYMENLELNTASAAMAYLRWRDGSIHGTKFSFLNMIRIAKEKVKDPAVLETVVAECAGLYFIMVDSDIDTVYEEVAEVVKDEAKMKQITDMYNVKKKLAPGSPAIDCLLEDTDGKTAKLSDHFGKVLYIDVWATTCGPCCAEIPHLEKLVEHYKNDDRIEFISVSIDDNRDAWLKKLAKDKPQCKQYISDDIMGKYSIMGIPMFIMIGKDEKIITVSAPRPSNPEIIQFIDSNLK